MKIPVLMVLLIMICAFGYVYAGDFDVTDIIKPIEEYVFALKESNIDRVEYIVVDKNVKEELRQFISKYEVLHYSYYITSLEEKNGKYIITLKNRIKYRKIKGLSTVETKFSSKFIVAHDFNKSIYVITESDFFDELYFGVKLGIFVLGSLIIVLPFLGHAFIHKRKKWIVIIGVLNVVGVAMYYVFEIKKIFRRK